MKYYWLFLLFFCSQIAAGQVNYDQHFTENALRLDFLLAGDANEEEIYLQHLSKEKPWAGPKNNLVTPFEYGNYAVKAFSENDKLIYFRGFSTLFEEWVTTEKAKTVKKAFQHTIRIPYPKKKITIEILKRNYATGRFNTILKQKIDPSDYFINEEKPPKINVTTIQKNGDPNSRADIVFLSEGYTEQEMDIFIKDVKNITNYIFSQEPFSKYQEKFNVYAVKAVSQETGTDIPGKNKYKNTVFNSSFYTFDSPRYLTSTATWKIRDMASVVPYDHIVILTNSFKYGGGGFYNHFSLSSNNHQLSKKVLIHEFGHGFAGLGDEYYTSKVAYSNFYNLDVEPWEPNITTRTNFEAKWEDMIKEETPVPTPREKKYSNTVGLFEGGGYLSEGIYSPYMNCRMKSNMAKGFCPVCQKAIERMILYYSGELE
jgi:hypothetical protein